MNESAYCLKHLSDQELLEGLASLCRRSNQLTAELLAHLAEVEARRLHVVHGCSSLFDYCISRLGHTEDEAGRRIHAARAARRFPELLPMLARGEMHLSTINLIAAHFGDNDGPAKGLIEAARGKTKREVEELLAARFAKPDAPTRLMPLASTPAPAAGSAGGQANAALPLFAAKDTAPLSLAGVVARDTTTTPRSSASVPPTRQAPAPASPLAGGAAGDGTPRASASVPPTSQASAPAAPLSATPTVSDPPVARYRLQVTISRAARNDLLRAQALLAHTIPDGDVGLVLERALALLCEDLAAKKFGKLKRRAPAPETSEPGTSEPGTSENARGPAANASVPGRAAASGRTVDATAAIAAGQIPKDQSSQAKGAPRSHGGARKGGKRSRTIPRAVRRQVSERDECRCTYVAPDGRRCNERRLVEFNHKTPFARGGEATVDSVNLLCRVHNDLQARRDFGESHMRAVKARRRADREKPRSPEG